MKRPLNAVTEAATAVVKGEDVLDATEAAEASDISPGTSAA